MWFVDALAMLCPKLQINSWGDAISTLQRLPWHGEINGDRELALWKEVSALMKVQ